MTMRSRHHGSMRSRFISWRKYYNRYTDTLESPVSKQARTNQESRIEQRDTILTEAQAFRMLDK